MTVVDFAGNSVPGKSAMHSGVLVIPATIIFGVLAWRR